MGWALAHKKITNRIRKVHDALTVGAPTPFQKAGVRALNLAETYYESLKNRYAQARDRLCRALLDAGFDLKIPKGAYYIMADTDRLISSLGADGAFAFSLKLIDLSGIATVPGTAFYHTAEWGNPIRRCIFPTLPARLL